MTFSITIKREEQRRNIMLNKSTNSNVSIVSMAVRTTGSSSLTQNRAPSQSTNGNQSSTGGNCTHCISSKHFVGNYFKMHGYPEWWNDMKERKARETREQRAKRDGKATVMTGIVAPPRPISADTLLPPAT